MDLQFGHYLLKRAERQLLGPTGPVDLSARSFDILAVLLNRPDEVISKSELFDAVWPGLVVEENTLQVHVSALRKSLSSGMITTIHGRGYKYAGPRPTDAKADGPDGPIVHDGLAGKVTSTDYKPVIAVLPFTNLSGDVEQDYFSDGITEDIIIELSRYRPLNVVSRHSSSRFKGAAVDIKEVGRRLGAQYLVEGSIRKVDGSIRVTAQLLEAATANHVWAERYDQELGNVFSMQDELVRRLVSTIAGHVEKHTYGRAQTKVTENLDAYDCWLRANHGFDLWTRDGNMSCKRLLEEAIKRDPLFARAHASLAFCNIRAAIMSPGSPEIPWLDAAAVQSAELAVRLDPSEARAHNALGWSQMYFREFERARSEFKISASLNPNDGSACIDRAFAWSLLGEQSIADETANIAAALNPLGGEWFFSMQATVHFTAGRYEAAEEYFALIPRNLSDMQAWRAANLTYLGRQQQASEAMLQALESLRLQWCGPVPMQTEDFVAWFRHNNMFQRNADWEHLFDGMLKAGLPQK